MSSNTRHGRRIPLPSTRQIRHELLVLADREAARLKIPDDAKHAVIVQASDHTLPG